MTVTTSRDELVARAHRNITHLCPPEGAYRTPCCNRTPTSLGDATLTTDANLVTCDPVARAAGDAPSLYPPHEPPTTPQWPTPAPTRPESAWVPLSVTEAARVLTWAAAAHAAGVPYLDGDDDLLAKVRDVRWP